MLFCFVDHDIPFTVSLLLFHVFGPVQSLNRETMAMGVSVSVQSFFFAFFRSYNRTNILICTVICRKLLTIPVLKHSLVLKMLRFVQLKGNFSSSLNKECLLIVFCLFVFLGAIPWRNQLQLCSTRKKVRIIS